MTRCFIIAEAGVNHNGSEDLALELVEAAAKAGADAVKFQTFKAETLVAKGAATAEYQKKQTGSDDQYAMLEKLEMSEALHHKLVEHCIAHGVEFMSTAFDLDAAKFLIDIGVKRLKVPSGELTNIPFIRELAELNKPMIMSTGMATLGEVKEAVDAVRDLRDKYKLPVLPEEGITLLHCTSNYPTRNEDVNLNAMLTIAKNLGFPVGYSDHTGGLLVPVAAVAMGATIIEKHFTLDRDYPGPDHQASLEPDELTAMIKQIRQIEVCLGDGNKVPRDNELPVRDLVRRSIVLAKDMSAGEVLKLHDLVFLRPGTGISPNQIDSVLGKVLQVSMKSGDALSWSDLSSA